MTPPSRGDVPDAVFPTDNEWGVPSLLPGLQADFLDAPWLTWGATGRAKLNRGTWNFYAEDYRYEGLWRDPTPVVNSGCVNAVEPNFSVYGQMPASVALWAVYRKRWLARYWQHHGVRILVDLNVNEAFRGLNLLGVPRGWRAYATRGYTDRIGQVEEEYRLAADHAGTDDLLFVVHGGGMKVKELCLGRPWLWFPEPSDLARGRKAATVG